MKDKNFFKKYIDIFLEENHKLNLISKNDEKLLWEKHINDSLSLELFFNKYLYPQTLLDIGTGGGFPSVPLAMAYPDIEITALDSISKKIRSVQTIKDKLMLNNLNLICSRVENYNATFDVVTSRAVASLAKISDYALPKLKSKGYFVAFKSKKAEQEIYEAQNILKKHKAKVIDIINYQLPLEENLERCLIAIQKA